MEGKSVIASTDLISPRVEQEDEEVDWLECISAMETTQGLIYFCDASYGKLKNLPMQSSFQANFPEGTTLYSITAYNPFNKVTNRIVNELANCELIVDLRSLLPGCSLYSNFSYFPSRPHHFERGFTIQVPKNYHVPNHGMIIYSLCIKYQQAAFFKGVVMENGLTVPYVVLVQGEYTEIQEELVSISRAPTHPAFLHQANHAVFKDLNQVLDTLVQLRDKSKLCDVLLQTFHENFVPMENEGRKYPIIAIEGRRSTETASGVSQLLNAEFLGNTPECMKNMRHMFEHSTVLLSAYKTLSDYIQSSEISRKAMHSTVIVNKYWCNTAAGLIVTEVNKGQSNLPPKDHDVYKWPNGLLKPDATVLVSSKARKERSAEQSKLKGSALKRMKDLDWIAITCGGKEKGDVVSSHVVDKLRGIGIVLDRPVDSLCPANPVPLNSKNTEPDDYLMESPVSSPLPLSPEEGKPFWF